MKPIVSLSKNLEKEVEFGRSRDLVAQRRPANDHRNRPWSRLDTN